MKNIPKYSITLIFNLIPVLLAYFIFYKNGIWSVLLYVPLWHILSCINFAVSNGSNSFTLLSAFTVLCAWTTELLSTYLYFNRISSDSETILVGYLGAAFVAISVLVFSLSLLFVKLSKKRLYSPKTAHQQRKWKNRLWYFLQYCLHRHVL